MERATAKRNDERTLADIPAFQRYLKRTKQTYKQWEQAQTAQDIEELTRRYKKLKPHASSK